MPTYNSSNGDSWEWQKQDYQYQQKYEYNPNVIENQKTQQEQFIRLMEQKKLEEKAKLDAMFVKISKVFSRLPDFELHREAVRTFVETHPNCDIADAINCYLDEVEKAHGRLMVLEVPEVPFKDVPLSWDLETPVDPNYEGVVFGRTEMNDWCGALTGGFRYCCTRPKQHDGPHSTTLPAHVNGQFKCAGTWDASGMLWKGNFEGE